MEILTGLQIRILRIFSGIPDAEAFYLTGGTALSAFFLKHRKSNDLDFFTPVEEVVLPFSRKLEESLSDGHLKVERLTGFHSFVELSVTSQDESTSVHLAVDSPFRFEKPFVSEEIPGLRVDSLIDIATNKLLTLYGRAALRDFIDVSFLVEECFTREQLMRDAAQKDPGFDLYWLGVAMERVDSFPDDSPEMHLLVRPCSMKTLKEFFHGWRRDIIREVTTK